MTIALDDDFPRVYAQTDRLRRGMPRTFAVTDQHVTFLRSSGPFDGSLSLWRFEAGSERCLVHATELSHVDGDLPPAERARRERLRESGAGITSYSMSSAGDRIAFAVGGVLWLWDEFGLRSVATPGAVFDPRIDGAGELVACVIDGVLQVRTFVDGDALAEVARKDCSVGLPDFVASEELGRHRGHWWSPSGDMVLAEVVNEQAVPLWRIADPTYPDRMPQEHRYPHAGGPNAVCSLLLLDVAAATVRDIAWDQAEFEYLVSVQWAQHPAPLITLANREQTRFQTFELDLATAQLSTVLVAQSEPWIDVTPGVPARLPDGRLVHVVADRTTDTRRLVVGDEYWTAPGFHVSAVLSVNEHGVVLSGSEEPRTLTALHIGPDGSATHLSDGFTYCQLVSNGTTHVRSLLSGDSTEKVVEVMHGQQVIGSIPVHCARVAMPAPEYVELAGMNAVMLWPESPTGGPLPVVLSPYGGPHHLEVIAAAGTFAEDQWLANQGFCVVIADGRGTPGRGLQWEHAIADRLAEITLEDQVHALQAALALFPDRLNGTRVGIRGWSFGGYLAALAVLSRPDVFHAAIAGAPVTEWRLYDTAYTERYLGLPNKAPEVYDANSLLPLAANLQGRLMIIHGLADDNVVSAHALQLSAALLAAGKRHEFLPLAGVSHMTPQATITENLMRMQADYFREHLRPG